MITLSYLLCIQCTPTDRPWPGQCCDRCSKRGLSCGPNTLPGRLKHRKQNDDPGPDLSGSCDVPGLAVSQGTQKQDLSEKIESEQPINQSILSTYQFVAQILDGAMMYDYPKVIEVVILDKRCDFDSPPLQEYAVKLFDWAMSYHHVSMIKLFILQCSYLRFENALQQCGIRLLDWAYECPSRRSVFRALLYWKIVYGRMNGDAVLLRAVEKRYVLVGIEIARLMLQLSGIHIDTIGLHPEKESARFSTSNDKSWQDSDNDCRLDFRPQIDDLEIEAIVRGDYTKLTLSPLELPADYLLDIAVRYEQPEAVKQLLSDTELNVVLPDGEGNTMLHHIALLHRWPDLLGPLLCHPRIDINVIDKDGSTPLMLACAAGTHGKEVLDLLLRREDLNVNAQNKDGTTALHEAVKDHPNETKESAEMLLHRPDLALNIKDAMGDTPLLAAVKYTVGKHRTVVIDLLLKQKGIDVDARDHLEEAALLRSVIYDDRAVVKSILSHPAVNVNARNYLGYAAIFYAIGLNDTEVLTDLLQQPTIDINTHTDTWMTPLIYAVQSHSVETVTLLCSRKDININAQDEHGKTALHYAGERWLLSLDHRLHMILSLFVNDRRTLRLPDYEGNVPNVSRFLEEEYRDRDIPGSLSRWSI